MKKLLMASTLLVFSMPAFADAVFTLGNHPQPGEENVSFGSVTQTGKTIQALSASGVDVQFTSTVDTLVGKHGQADLASNSGLIHNLDISVSGYTFQDFILNPFKLKANTDLAVSVTTNDGIFGFVYGSTKGNNFLTITTSGGELIEDITLTSARGFENLKQPRISGLAAVVVPVSSGSPVPEPSTLAMLSSGLVGMAGVLRRKLV